MPYCDLNDLLNASSERDLIQLTDDDRSGAIDETVISEMIEKADALIDGYVGSRYSLPLDPAPELINSISVDITIFNLYKRRSRLNKEIIESFKIAERQLERIQAGRITLPGAAEIGGDNYGTGEVRVNKTPDDRIFPRSELDKW